MCSSSRRQRCVCWGGNWPIEWRTGDNNTTQHRKVTYSCFKSFARLIISTSKQHAALISKHKEPKSCDSALCLYLSTEHFSGSDPILSWRRTWFENLLPTAPLKFWTCSNPPNLPSLLWTCAAPGARHQPRHAPRTLMCTPANHFQARRRKGVAGTAALSWRLRRGADR